MNRRILIGCDRDGVLIHNHKTLRKGRVFNRDVNDLDVIDRVPEGIKLLSKYNTDLYIITNQAWLLDGNIDENYRICRNANQALIKRINYNEVIKGFRITDIDSEHLERAKAKAKIMETLITNHLDYEKWFIGDSKSDIEAGKMCGCITIQVLPKFDCNNDIETDADYVVKNFYDACRIIDSNGVITIRRKPIEFPPVTVKVVTNGTVYTDMAGEHVVNKGDVLVIHEDGSYSSMSREAYKSLYIREELL